MKTEGMEVVIEWSEKLTAERLYSIYYCTEEVFSTSITIFQSEVNERKPLTLTDAVVYLYSQKLDCDEILTFDDRLKNYPMHT